MRFPSSSFLFPFRRIPHGFFEDQLKGFFSQFGDVKRWRVSRSKKSAKSKGYAFVEFAHAEVAAIAADAMNGYLMFKQALKCHVMKKDDVHPKLFTDRNKQMKKVRGPCPPLSSRCQSPCTAASPRRSPLR